MNLSKSSIFLPSRSNISRAPLLERELGFKISRSFGKYLGAPIITDDCNKQVYDFLVEKVQTKLAGWKARTLSMVGRCTLINSITSAIPTHVMQYCLLPTTISKELDKLNRNFLWGDTIEKKKVHLLNWKIITQAKKDGGLGIKRSKSRNLALLANRAWKLHFPTSEVWANLFKSKYLATRSLNYRKSIVHKGLRMAAEVCDRGKG